MLLNKEELFQLHEQACKAALKAGILIMEHFGGNIEKKQKKAGSSEASSIVTEVDFKAEKLILEQLQAGTEKYDLGLLAEESVDNNSRLQKSYFWCIDPLDGTKPFSENKPGFAVSIALIDQAGIPHIGVAYDPVNQNMYSAIKGSGTWKNEQAWKISPAISGSLAFYYNQSFTTHNSFPKVKSELEKIALKHGLDKVSFPQRGGAVLNALWAAENTPSCFFAFPKPEDGGGSIWDYAATVCIYKELGLHISDIYGEELELNKEGSTFMNVCGVLYADSAEIAGEAVRLYGSLVG